MSELFSMSNKSVVITGASSGIGLALCEYFLSLGATVGGIDRISNSSLEHKNYFHSTCDVRLESSVTDSLSELANNIGYFDVLIFNAGYGPEVPLIENTSSEYLDTIIDVNLKGVFFGLKHGPHHMSDGGSIIITSSASAEIRMPGFASYGCTKAGAIYLGQIASLELGSKNIRVNSVCPSVIATPMLKGKTASLDMSGQCAPLQRHSTVDDLFGIFHFLASEASSYVSGQSIYVDGGWSAGRIN